MMWPTRWQLLFATRELSVKILPMRSVLVGLFLLSLLMPKRAFGIYNPLSVPNNRIGIHILDPGELFQAVKLVNGNGGKWGYVTVPIQAADRDRKKWQAFMGQARLGEVIPILRLATYARGDTWVKPTEDDILDFANFLNELSWPTKNRYVIVFNEPNHAQEWGGEVDPAGYARILRFAIQVFKNKSEDFFLIPAGLDAAAPNSTTTLSSRMFIQKVGYADPGVFSLIDGWAAHSYPNPDFSGLPTDRGRASIVGYRYELNEVKRWAGERRLPVFITETGWQHREISPRVVSEFLKKALEQVWVDDNVVAVTPFVLSAFDGPFEKFSFLDKGSATPQSRMLENFPKVAGLPLLSSASASPREESVPPPQPGQSPLSPLWDVLAPFLRLGQ